MDFELGIYLLLSIVPSSHLSLISSVYPKTSFVINDAAVGDTTSWNLCNPFSMLTSFTSKNDAVFELNPDNTLSFQ